MSRIPILLVLFPVISACETLGIRMEDEDETYRRTIEVDGADYDEGWTAIIETFADLDLPIATLEKESGLVATDWILLTPPGRYASCGRPVRSEEGRFNVFLKRTDGEPEMTITSSYRAVATAGDDAGALVPCASTERMEEEIQAGVLERVD